MRRRTRYQPIRVLRPRGPGNVFVPAAATGLPRDSVVNVTALVTLDMADLDDEVGYLPAALMDDVDRGLRRVLVL